MNLLKKLFHFAISIVISLLIFEIYLISSEICLPRKGYKSKIGISEFFPNRRIFLIKEGFYMGKTNKNGTLGDEFEPTKTKNILRIALIGDSYVEGFQVFPRYHFSYHLKSKLKESFSDKKIELLNFGISGLNFGGMFDKYLNIIKYQPDYIFFFLHNRNFNGVETGTINRILNYHTSDIRVKSDKANFIKDLGLYSFIGNVYSLFKSNTTEAFQILFDKFYILLELTTISKPEKNIGDIEFNYTAITNVLDQIQMRKAGEIYFVEINDLDESIKRLLYKHNIKIFSLRSAYQNVLQQGSDPFYWATINGKAHWNHLSHSEIGKFLADFIIEEQLSRE
jgi:hypothetical protein